MQRFGGYGIQRGAGESFYRREGALRPPSSRNHFYSKGLSQPILWWCGKEVVCRLRGGAWIGIRAKNNMVTV